jgi:EAL domain-containing protein (putative c-di-GMP-specific phosphodiesterase class I)
MASYIRDRVAKGPWSDNHVAGSLDPRVDRPEFLGHAVVTAPVVYRGRPVAVLFAATRTRAVDSWIARYLRVTSELATHISPLLGAQLDLRDSTAGSRDEIRRIIDRVEFAALFQPVCDLTTRQPVGWEALARFDDVVSPTRRFADAHLLGMGEELEIVCGEQAIAAFNRLDRPGWLSVNISPSLVMSGRVAALVRNAGRPLVLELTEHVRIDDYPLLRGAIDLLDPPAMIAIDDTGAGYASLRHVLELRPDYVKLDLGFVHAIDSDPARQAMVAGMVHYAAETGTRLIAEGIETEAERRTLLRLGVPLGQGFLLGVPTTGAGVEPRRGVMRQGPRRLRAVDGSDARTAAG